MSDQQSDNSEIADLPGVGSVTVSKLSAAGVHTLMDLMARGPMDIASVIGDKEKARNIVEIARKKLTEEGIIFGFQTASQVLVDRQKAQRITTGSKALDDLLGGGIETKAITELYGEFGASKSQLCMQLSVNVQLPPEKGGVGGKAIFMDTEGTFRPERLVQMAKARGLDPEKVLDNVLTARVYNSTHQELMIKALGEQLKGDVRLVVVDSAIAHYRAEYLGRETLSERQQRINSMLHKLISLAELHNIAVVITNQVQATPDQFFGNPIKAAGGNVLAHTSTYRIYLRKGSKGTRVAKIIDSPYHPEAEAVFEVTTGGITDVAEK